MLAEIIAIGTEITSGAKLDTNSQWLSLELADLGIRVGWHTTVADDLDANIAALQIAAERADLVVITGGLGPTLDDLTREAMAGLAGCGLVLHEPSLRHVEGFFRSRGREMPARNRVQAMFPEIAQPLANPVGTAPGIWMELARPGRTPCLLAALPGVPSEMKKMYFEQVRPRLHGGEVIIRRARINCFGIGESATEELLGDLTARGREPEIGITAHEATITLRIIAQGRSVDKCQQQIADAAAQIRERLGIYVFGEEDDELEHAVARLLVTRNQTLATVECGTCGLLAERLAQVPEAAAFFRAGTVLPVMTAGLEETARQYLSPGAADFLLCLGPEVWGADPDGRPVSHIEAGLLTAGGEWHAVALPWGGNPAITRSRAAKCGLDLLRRFLLGVTSTAPAPEKPFTRRAGGCDQNSNQVP